LFLAATRRFTNYFTKNKKHLAKGKPKSLAFAEAGVRTSGDFAGMMSALMSDTISGKVSPQVTNAAVNAGGKLLKVVEMQLRYGKPTTTGTRAELALTPAAEPTVEPATV
jgi:hypothetical protein